MLQGDTRTVHIIKTASTVPTESPNTLSTILMVWLKQSNYNHTIEVGEFIEANFNPACVMCILANDY